MMAMLMRYIFFVLWLFVFQAAYAETLFGRVVAVADGDTLTLLDQSNRQHKIRLTGIDAPEKSQPYGNRARVALSNLVFGKQVEADCMKRDRYGRELCKVLLDGADVNLAQLRTGMAWWYRKYAKEQPKLDQSEYEKTEASAKEKRLGLWADTAPIPPWEWRHPSSR